MLIKSSHLFTLRLHRKLLSRSQKLHSTLSQVDESLKSSSKSQTISTAKTVSQQELIHIHNDGRWPRDLFDNIRSSKDAKVFENFIAEEEERSFERETYQQLRRLRYEDEHWDDAIRRYREIEKTDWSSVCAAAIQRVRELAFPKTKGLISSVHVLDLAADGYIKPHIDAERYCGDTIAGLSLLSDSVMRLIHKDHKQCIFDLYLKRCSMYILTGVARYEFTHEILVDAESVFKDTRVPRTGRRLAVICRDLPKSIEGVYDDGKPV